MTNRFDQHTEYASFSDGKRLYFELRSLLDAAGCFRSETRPYVIHMLAVLGLYIGGFCILLLNPAWKYRLLVLVTVSFANVQAGVLAHEAGHGAITRRRWLIDLICLVFNTFLTALCYSHFQRIHKCHHAHTNEIDRDVDAQSGIFSLYPESVRDKHTRFSRFVTRHQGVLIWPLVTLQGFSLKYDSIRTLIEFPQRTRNDQFALLLHCMLWFGLPVYILGFPPALANYLLMTWFAGPYLGSIFLPNNVGMYYLKPGEAMPYMHQQLITTRNLGKSRLDDLIFGGLNHHIEHHLFPTVSMYKLRSARRITEQFCREHRLPYNQTTWFRAMSEIHAHLKQVGKMCGKSADAVPG